MKKLYSILLFISIVTFVYADYPAGYYNSLTGKTGASLKTALHNIICQDTTHYLKYGSGTNHTWRGFYSTDRDITNNSIIDMYSSSIVYFPTNYTTSSYPGFGNTVEIEHSVPKSWWKCDITHPDCAAEDLNHLYPANGSTNSSKGDNPLGVVVTPTKDNGVSKIGTGYYEGYNGAVFEPADEYKGDFARSYLYVATAYEHYANKWDLTKSGIMFEANTYPTVKSGALNLLLQWHRQDPVSQKELTRVEKVYSIQKNRNPFIDYPDLVEYVWGNKVGTAWNMSTFIENNTIDNLKIIFHKSQKSILIQSDKDLSVNLGIYSIEGKIITQQSVSTNATVNIPNLANGIYIVKVSSGNQIITQKILL